MLRRTAKKIPEIGLLPLLLLRTGYVLPAQIDSQSFRSAFFDLLLHSRLLVTTVL